MAEEPDPKKRPRLGLSRGTIALVALAVLAAFLVLIFLP